MNQRLFPILASLILSSCGVFLQKSGVKNYSPQEEISRKDLNKYQYDFLYLTRLLEESFPQLDSIFPENERAVLAQEIMSELSGVESNANFILRARKYLSNLKNQHTNIYLDQQFGEVYPYVIYIAYDDWYLLNLSQRYDSLHLGKKITGINGMSASEMENRLIDFTFAENKISQQFEICDLQLYNKPQYLKQIGVIRDDSEALKLKFEDHSEVVISQVSTKGNLDVFDISIKENDVTKKQKETYLAKVYHDENFGYLQFNYCHDKIDILDGIKSYVKPRLQPMARRYVERQFNKDKPSQRIAEYYNPAHPVFKDLVWQLIDSLNNSGIGNLIIDLRHNPGGNLLLGIQLMYFLTDKDSLRGFTEYAYTSDIYKEYFQEEYQALEIKYPQGIPSDRLILTDSGANLFSEITDKNSGYYISKDRPVFTGHVYILSNHRTSSAAAMLTTLLQDNGIGMVIGTSVGNNPIGPTTYTPMVLPKTKAKVSIASTWMVRPLKGRGGIQAPDVWVEYTVDDLIQGTDPYLEIVKKEIGAKVFD